MTETQDEKELILGNKQLISLFFVVVALCGVCFAMGYIIGHNSSKPAAAPPDMVQAQPAPARTQDSEPPRDAAAQPGEPSPDATSPQDSSSPAAPDSSAGPSGASGSIATQPGRDVPQTAHETEPVAVSTTPQPGGGSYLQVSAVSKADAENLVRTLREQNLPALIAESPKKGLFRVLVGPYRQTSELADAKSRLKTLGFDNAFVQR